MLVFGLLLPPLTSTSPLGRTAVPGQNISAPVTVTKTSVEVSLTGSNTPL